MRTGITRGKNRQDADSYPHYKVIQSARYNDIKLTLCKEQVDAIVASPCYYCGSTMNVGLDRKDSNGIYESDNVLPCCSTCNRMKGGHLPSVFIERCRDVVKHQSDATYSGLLISTPKRVSFAAWKAQCRGRNIPVIITSFERDEVLKSPCFACGATPAGTIDRMDSLSPYQLENIQPACYMCNMAKFRLSDIDFLNQCALIVSNHTVASSTSVSACALCDNSNMCYAEQLCCSCYYSKYYDKNRDLSDRPGYDTMLAKHCALCGVKRSIERYIEPSATVCLDCQSC